MSSAYDFLEIREGQYRLVPESDAKRLTNAMEAIEILGIDPTETKKLSFVVRFYRFKADLTKSELASQADLSRHTIRNIEEVPDHKVDHATLVALSKFFTKKFGSSFDYALEQIGHKI